MMQMHSLLIDIRLKRVTRVSKWRQSIGITATFGTFHRLPLGKKLLTRAASFYRRVYATDRVANIR